MSIEEVKNSDEFEEKIVEKSIDIPVLVDFWAEWCLPCKKLGPKIKEVSEELEGKIDVVKANIDEVPEKAEEYGVKSIPNVKLLIDGEVTDGFAGVKSKQEIVEWVEERI